MYLTYVLSLNTFGTLSAFYRAGLPAHNVPNKVASQFSKVLRNSVLWKFSELYV